MAKKKTSEPEQEVDLTAPLSYVKEPCKDCGEEVGFVVDPYQLVGTSKFICGHCRAKRISAKHETARVKAISDLQKELEKAQAAARAQGLPGFKE